MTFGSKIRRTTLGLLGLSLALMLGLAAYVNWAASSSLGDAYANAKRSAAERRNDQVRWLAQGELAPLAQQVGERRLSLLAQVQELGVSRLALDLVSPKFSRAARQQGLASMMRGREGIVHAARVTDSRGRVVAAWAAGRPDEKALGQDLSKETIYGLVSRDSSRWGLALEAGYQMEQGAAARKPAKPPKPQKGARPAPPDMGQGVQVVVVGIKDAAGKFAGLLETRLKVESLFGLDPQAALEPVKAVSQSSVVLLLQGTGLEYFNTAGKAFKEDFGKVSSDFRAALNQMALEERGGLELTYDGKKGMLIWQRIGFWDKDIAGPDQLHVLAAFMPFADFTGAGKGAREPGTLWADPIFWALFAGLGIALMLAGSLFLKSSLAPLEDTVFAAGHIDEFGTLDEPVEFPEQRFSDLNTLTTALNLLMQRASTTETRVKELDDSLHRAQAQAGQEATELQGEISRLREKITAVEMERDQARADSLGRGEQLKQLQAKTGNLQAAVDTAQKSLDLKNSQNKTLSGQVQELMGALEEQRKLAEVATENTVNRGSEEVRLEAVKTLSSELKATLGVIKNYISTMLGSVGKISDAQQEFLGVVINKSARLERLINDLVDLSQIGSGLTPPNLQPTDLGGLIRECILNVQVQADHKKISLDYAEGGSSPEARVDRERLGQVLRILLTQAIKVTARGEKISLLTASREGQVEIRISDPGMSLPPDRAEKVFTLFHGVDSQAGPEFIGTGLRFPIVRSVLESHGGTVKIESQVGRGKTFVLRLPVGGQGAKPAAPPRSFAPAPPTATPRPTGVPAPPPKAVPPPPQPSSTPFPPKPAPPPPDLEKPKAVPATLATPWKGEKVSHVVAGAEELAKASKSKELPAFGGAPLSSKPAPPPPLSVPAPPPLSKDDTAAFDKIFGAPPTGKPAPPPAKPAPPPPGAVPAPPPLKKEDAAAFDKIFGAPSPPPARPAPPPGAVPAPPPPPAPKGGLNTMDDLSDMIGGL